MTTLRPTTVQELADLVREAAHTASPGGASRLRSFRIQGAGTWMDAGRAAEGAARLELGAFAGVRAYEPNDLTITVGATTTLAELDAVTRAHGQWCPLLPWGDDAGTVGATIATATSGPFADSQGRPRDLVLGLECVDGRGRVVRAGGRVVKNVAGFDLTRLMTGAWGTLGVITELHLRLRARPAVDESFRLCGGAELDEPLRALARGVYAPLGVARVGADAGADVGADAPGDARWLVRLGGNSAFVAASRAAYAQVGRVESCGSEAWDVVRARSAPADRTATWRWNTLSRRIKTLFDPSDLLNRGLLGEVA